MSYVTDNFHKWTPAVRTYSNGRKAVEYITEEEGYPERACLATINLPDEDIEDDEVIIKSYSENEGIYNCMLEAGHIGQALRHVHSGFISAPVCKLLLS